MTIFIDNPKLLHLYAQNKNNILETKTNELNALIEKILETKTNELNALIEKILETKTNELNVLREKIFLMEKRINKLECNFLFRMIGRFQRSIKKKIKKLKISKNNS